MFIILVSILTFYRLTNPYFLFIIYSKTIKPNLVWEVDEDYGFGYYRLDGAAKLFALGIFTVEGTGDNVIFRCADGYNLDLKGGIDTTEWDQEAIRDTISHKNIIFDCVCFIYVCY